eukprot:c7317_g1_i1.p1 GENE.c7317_g1_i1~~c7317_g1_i1.p1  ORF type:complete len:168 (+),score=41.69 c7317_g1_i1:580-1083(+)
MSVCGHDIVWDMNKLMVSRAPAPAASGTSQQPQSRVVSCAQHVLEQQCFFPIFPACNHNVDGATPLHVAVDYVRIREMSLLPPLPTREREDQQQQQQPKLERNSPHLLILPSIMKEFAAELHGVVCVNPGRLMRSDLGGTFARITVLPRPKSARSIAGLTKVEIVRF